MNPEDDYPRVPNVAGAVRNNLPVTRDENGYITGLASEDPSRASEYRLLQGLQRANAQNMPQPKPPSGWELAGSGLQLFGGVADTYFTGRRDLFNNMQAAVQGRTDARSEQQRKLDEMMAANAQAINQEGYKVASESLTDKRIKKETARRQAGAVLALSLDANGNPTPAAIRQAAEIAARAGDTAYEKHFNDMLQGSSGGSAGPSDVAPAQAAPAAAAQVTGGDMPSRQYVEDAKREAARLQGVLAGLDPKQDAAIYKPVEERLKAAQERAAKFENTYAEEDAKSLFKKQADSEKLMKEAPKAASGFKAAHETMNKAIGLIDKLIVETNSGAKLAPGTEDNFGGWVESYGMNAPGGDAATAWANVEQLKSLFELEGLGKIKDRFGSVGTVTEAEWPKFSSTFTSLDPNKSKPAVLKDLVETRKQLLNAIKSGEDEYGATYGTPLYERQSVLPPQDTSTASPSRTSVDQPRSEAKTSPGMETIGNMQEGETITLGGILYRKAPDGQLDEVPIDPPTGARPGLSREQRFNSIRQRMGAR